MNPSIKSLPETIPVGLKLRMSFAPNETKRLGQSFMPRRKEILNAVGTEFCYVEVYDSFCYFESFNPTSEFEK